jgi:hypothetical protein
LGAFDEGYPSAFATSRIAAAQPDMLAPTIATSYRMWSSASSPIPLGWFIFLAVIRESSNNSRRSLWYDTAVFGDLWLDFEWKKELRLFSNYLPARDWSLFKRNCSERLEGCVGIFPRALQQTGQSSAGVCCGHAESRAFRPHLFRILSGCLSSAGGRHGGYFPPCSSRFCNRCAH